MNENFYIVVMASGFLALMLVILLNVIFGAIYEMAYNYYKNKKMKEARAAEVLARAEFKNKKAQLYKLEPYKRKF